MSETRRTLSLLWSQEVEANALMGRLTACEIPPFGPEFKTWRDQTTKVVFRYFPENGREAQEWAKVFFPRRVYCGRDDPIRTEDCTEVLAEAITFLDETCRKLKEQMHGEAIVLADEAVEVLLASESVDLATAASPEGIAGGRMSEPAANERPPAAVPGSALEELINEVAMGYIPLQPHVKEGAMHQLLVLRDELARPYPSWEVVRSALMWLSGSKAIFLRILPEVANCSERIGD